MAFQKCSAWAFHYGAMIMQHTRVHLLICDIERPGAAFGLYAGVIGLILWSRTADFRIVSLFGGSPLTSITIIAASVFVGALGGGLFAGRMARTRPAGQPKSLAVEKHQ
jgi:hypothetical protein